MEICSSRCLQVLRLIEEEGPEAHLRDADWPVPPSFSRGLCCYVLLYFIYVYDFYFDTGMGYRHGMDIGMDMGNSLGFWR